MKRLEYIIRSKSGYGYLVSDDPIEWSVCPDDAAIFELDRSRVEIIAEVYDGEVVEAPSC